VEVGGEVWPRRPPREMTVSGAGLADAFQMAKAIANRAGKVARRTARRAARRTARPTLRDISARYLQTTTVSFAWPDMY
jgi:hypothetical protein